MPLSYPVLTHPILSYPAFSHPILSHPVMSSTTTSYPIMSCVSPLKEIYQRMVWALAVANTHYTIQATALYGRYQALPPHTFLCKLRLMYRLMYHWRYIQWLIDRDGIPCYDMILCDMIWCITIWCDMIWYDMIRCDMMWYDMIWYDMIWYDMIYHDIIWYDI